MEESQKTGNEVGVEMVRLCSLVEIEDLIVLTKTVAVKIAVRIVEQNALGVEVRKRPAPLNCLPESCGILERKAFLA